MWLAGVALGALSATHRLPSQPSLALPRGPAARRFVTPSCALAPSHHPSIHPSISPASRRRPPPKPAGSINPCTRLLPIQPSLARAGPGAGRPALNLLNPADQSKPTHTRSTHRVHPHTHLGRTAPAGSTPPASRLPPLPCSPNAHAMLKEAKEVRETAQTLFAHPSVSARLRGC